MLRALGALGWALPPIWAHKVGGALLAALCVPAAWWTGERLRPGAGFSVALLAAASPSLTHLAGDFAKNLGMAAPLLIWLGALLVPPRSARGWVLPLVAGVLAATAHRLGAVFVVGSGLAFGLGRLQWRALLGLAAGVLAFAGIAQGVPGLLHPQDWERVSGTLDLSLHWPRPLGMLSLRSTSPLQLAEWCLGWPALAVTLSRRRLWPLAAPLALTLLVPWDQSVLDLGYRLLLVSPLLWMPLVALLPPIPAPARPWSLVALPVALSGFQPRQHPPYARYRALIAALPVQPELLIAHQGLNFLYDHETGGEAMAWAPEPELDPARVGRIAWGIEPGEWPEGAEVTALGAGYVYLSEQDWRGFIAELDPGADEDLLERTGDWRNPSRVRPASLRRGR